MPINLMGPALRLHIVARQTSKAAESPSVPAWYMPDFPLTRPSVPGTPACACDIKQASWWQRSQGSELLQLQRLELQCRHDNYSQWGARWPASKKGRRPASPILLADRKDTFNRTHSKVASLPAKQAHVMHDPFMVRKQCTDSIGSTEHMSYPELDASQDCVFVRPIQHALHARSYIVYLVGAITQCPAALRLQE